MLTHRKKQQIFCILLGFLLGLVVAVIVGYFGVIRQFTKLQIEKIGQIFPTKTDTIVVNVNTTPSHTKVSKLAASSMVIVDSTDADSEIQGDRIVSTMRVNMQSLDSTITEMKELVVEQWESPMHFVGYKLSKDKLQIYGVDISDVEFAYKGNDIYLVVADNSIPLRLSDDFIHFSGVLFQRNGVMEE